MKMTLHYVSIFSLIILLTCYSIESIPLWDESTANIEHDGLTIDNDRTVRIHPLVFIPFICEHQDQFPLKLTHRFCSNPMIQQIQQQGQEQQAREKRIGWTISV